MAHEEDDDLYDEEFDFVDDDDVDESDDESDTEEEESSADDSDLADEPKPVRARADRAERPERGERDDREARDERDERDERDAPDAEPAAEGEEPLDEYGRPEQTPANYLVHVYEARKFHRTIDRPFTPEDAEAFATEFNRTNKNYNRFAITGKNDAKPKKMLEG